MKKIPSNSITVKETDKSSAVIVSYREYLKITYHLKEAKNQLDFKNVFKVLSGDMEGHLEKITKTFLKMVRYKSIINKSINLN